MASTDVYEKLGAFYLGREVDRASGELTDDYVLYDSRDLVTHAVIVGMTGSGKTGLGVGLLEEAAIDGVPALIVDPKGDLCNLKLQFPDLAPSDFRPWVQADDATRQGMSVEDFAANEATRWREGLSSWDQGGDRIRRLREAAEFTIYTPGSDSGVPVSILSSFAAPSEELRQDQDMLQDRISTTATSLLALLGIDADPLRSREHILLTNLFSHAWGKGQDLDLGGIIKSVQDPPFNRVGVMDLDSFFPAKDRFELSMTLNNLLAAPSFATWLQGEPLDVDRLLYTEEGRPRHAIFSIAHLSESERMFFMSLLLNQTLGWMRSRPGTTSLRALLYIDEIFGYMPPVAEPPSKKPLLTLLKQARAFGLGLVLATQNPVDLDYKGLSNAGTWFLGRLQTERDRDRVLDGLEGASAESGDSFDRREISEVLSSLAKRTFLLHNVHEDRPVIFQTRWVMSYLPGPMTRSQIRELTDQQDSSPGEDRVDADAEPNEARHQPRPTESVRPVLPPGIDEYFLPTAYPGGKENLVYEAQIFALAQVHFVDTRKDLAADETFLLRLEVPEDAAHLDWNLARDVATSLSAMDRDPPDRCTFESIPELITDKRDWARSEKQLAEHLYRTRRYGLLKSENVKEYSHPGESTRDFRIRLIDRSREERDRQVERLRKKYASKIRTLEGRIARAEDAVERERQQSKSAQMDTAISFGTTILNAVLGRKVTSSRGIGGAASTARGMSKISKESDDVRRAEAKLGDYRERLAEIEAEVEAEIGSLERKYDPFTEEFTVIQLKPRKTDIDIRMYGVVWVPHEMMGDGQVRPLS